MIPVRVAAGKSTRSVAFEGRNGIPAVSPIVVSVGGLDLNRSSAVLGPWVEWNSAQQKFLGEFGDAANQLEQPVYRKPFEVPRLV
jgi:hypothetical protein